jgi:hypothetical protein
LANELPLVRYWAAQRLLGDSTLTADVGQRVFAQKLPEKDPATNETTGYPSIIFHVQAARDTTGNGGRRVLSTALLCVKVYGDETTGAAMRRAAHRVDALLQSAPGSSVTWEGQTITVSGCFREQPLDGEEVDQGVTYPWEGGLYRVYFY